jgi:VIT1/CCC1 family predicted Fe2+/Mn2+ transporter
LGLLGGGALLAGGGCVVFYSVVGMSQALERVIAEQQARIDLLMSQISHGIDISIRANAQIEDIAKQAFVMLSHPNKSEKLECRHALKTALRNFGYCLTCECLPCECDGQYD